MSVRLSTPELLGTSVGRVAGQCLIAWLVLKFGWTAVWWLAGGEVAILFITLAIRAWHVKPA